MWNWYRKEGSSLEDSAEKAASLVLYSMDLPSVYKITGLDQL
jgi:hypothetical protein